MDRATHFTANVGGVELYPKKRLVTRSDFGDTIIRYRQQTVSFLNFGGTPDFVPATFASRTQRNFQFSAGIGWRF